MKRTAAMFLMVASLGGCVTADSGSPTMLGRNSGPSEAGWRPTVPGVQGPWGQPVPMAMPYAARPPSGTQLAQQMMAQSVPMGAMQGMPSVPGMPGSPGGAGSGVMQAGYQSAGGGSGVQQTSGFIPPSDVAPPHVPNAVAAVGAITGPGGPRFPTQRTEVRFVGPSGMKVTWPGPYGETRGNQIEAPGKYNFLQGAIYRLKLTDLPGRPGVDLYPTLEVVPANLRTDAYIAHSAVPLYFTDEDFEQVLGGNFLVKVIYLPNPQYADIAMTGGPEEVVSTRLEPGVDPIAEACKRGSILLIIRLGNIDLEAPNTPPMNAPNPYGNPGGGACIGMAPPPGMQGGPMVNMPAPPMMQMAGPMAPMMMPPAQMAGPMAPMAGMKTGVVPAANPPPGQPK